MSNIAMGSEIGNIIADRQALMAALSVAYNKDTLQKLRTELPAARGTVAADSATVRGAPWAKELAFDQEKLFAQSKAYDAISKSLGDFKDMLAKGAAENENLAAVTYGAAVAVGGLALAAGAAAFTLRGIGGKALPDLPTTKGGGLASKASGAAKQLVSLVLLILGIKSLNQLMMLDIAWLVIYWLKLVLVLVVNVLTLFSKQLNKARHSRLLLKKK